MLKQLKLLTKEQKDEIADFIYGLLFFLFLGVLIYGLFSIYAKGVSY